MIVSLEVMLSLLTKVSLEVMLSLSLSYFKTGMKRFGLSEQSTDEEIVKYWEKILIK